MSISINISIGTGDNADDSEYTIRKRGGCTLIFGQMPMNEFVRMAKSQKKDVFMSDRLATFAQCTQAFGTKQSIDALLLALEPGVLARGQRRYASLQMSDEAVRWLSIGHRGASSNAMFYILSGINPGCISLDKLSAYPHDPDDLGRCRLLLEQVPELAGKMHLLSLATLEWKVLAEHWDALCDQMDQESPRWREGVGTAKVTHNRMRDLLDVAAERTRADRASSDAPTA